MSAPKPDPQTTRPLETRNRSYPHSHWDDCPEHDWQEEGDFSLGLNRSVVECSKCGAPGERYNDTGEVYWPTT